MDSLDSSIQINSVYFKRFILKILEDETSWLRTIQVQYLKDH